MFWELNLHKSNDTESLTIEKLEKYLKKYIKLRLESDAPVGALLSGGLDSSIMVAMLSKITDEPVKTKKLSFSLILSCCILLKTNFNEFIGSL